MNRWRRPVLAAGLLAAMVSLLGLPPGRTDPVLPAGFLDQRIVGGLSEPVGMAFLPDGRLLVIERRTGWVRMVVDGAFASTDPVGVVGDVESGFWERGMLGIAVDPGWPARPYVYVFHSAHDSTSRLSRFRASGDLVVAGSGNLSLDPLSRYDVLRDLPDRAINHNGGTLRFGTDGMLFVSLGEDADPCAAQDTVSLRGVLLRLDVSGLPDVSGGPPPRDQLVAPGNPFATHERPEARLVWALGLRNPFRFHVDPADGSVFVADVGNELREEVSHVTAPAQNLGWPRFEGTVLAGSCPGQNVFAHTQPIYEYDRNGFESGSASAISAGIYRGGSCASCRFPDDHLGDYFVADFFEGFLRRLKRKGSLWALAPPIPGQPNAVDWARGLPYVSDFQFGSDGALWYCRFFDAQHSFSGEIHRIVASPGASGVGPGSAGGVRFAAPRPMPASDRVVLGFHLPREAHVSLDLHDAAGRRVARLIDREIRGAGDHEVRWDREGSGVRAPAGVYHARLLVGGAPLVRRIVLLP